MIRQEQPDTVTVYSGSTPPFTAKAEAPERPGAYSFPPIAACITGAARLMLALLERTVTDHGGTWVFCDTDSMAIIATHGDELIACAGGAAQMPDGTAAVRALSRVTVQQIRHRFDKLNPYDTDRVPHVLKVEETGTCYAISAKRYAIYTRQGNDIQMLKCSQIGLGRYLPPEATTSESRCGQTKEWIDESWRWILSAHDNPDRPLPDWAEQPALSRITVSSPLLHRPFARWNRARPWREQIKPHNFLLVADLDPFGLPPGMNPQRFRLIAPYDPRNDGRKLEWWNLYDPDGPSYRVTTDQIAPAQENLVGVKSYRQVIREYRLHPECKFNGANLQPSTRITSGLLHRRPVRAARVTHIGKESNRLEDVQTGLISDMTEVITDYRAEHWNSLRHLVLPVLDRHSGRELAALIKIDRRTVDRIRAGQAPQPKHREALLQLATELARSDLAAAEIQAPASTSPAILLSIWREAQTGHITAGQGGSS